VVQLVQWEYLAQPAQPELLGLTVQQEPPASLESLALLELQVFQELLARLVLRAVMGPPAQQVSSVSLVRLA
jgi:hypothetical protein